MAISSEARANQLLQALSQSVEGGGRLNADFWVAVRAYHKQRTPSKSKKAMIETRMQRVEKRGLTDAALSPTANCIYNNVKGVIECEQPMTDELKETLLLNIETLLEGVTYQ